MHSGAHSQSWALGGPARGPSESLEFKLHLKTLYCRTQALAIVRSLHMALSVLVVAAPCPTMITAAGIAAVAEARKSQRLREEKAAVGIIPRSSS